MNVIFSYMSDGIVDSVYWQDLASGTTMERTLKSDGSVSDQVLANGLDWVVNFLQSSHVYMYPAVVDDVRTAFKYLGKSSDLVQLLPEADIGPSD